MLELLFRIAVFRSSLMIQLCLVAVFAILFPLSVRADPPQDSILTAVSEIDTHLRTSWQRRGIKVAERSSDSEFCRRAWLDLAGVAPPVAQIREFLADQRADKRDRLVDQLLESPLHADHMATRWNKILLPLSAQSSFQQQANVDALHRWLRDQFIQNAPYDHFVGRFLTAGGAGNRGPAIFYTSRELEPKQVAAATSQVFMGIQLQCAECHDHPFDRWTQNDFWQYAAFFSQLENAGQNMNQGGIIEDRVGGEVTFPDSDEVATPMYPGVAVAPEDDPTGIRRRQLTIWMASRDNPYFARAAVNRVWAHLFGRGLVDPVDAMDEANQPSHPEVLDLLADYFVASKFDLRLMYATIARTDAYRLTSMIGESDPPPADSFAAMMPKTLTAAQYYDSLQQNILRQSPLVAAGPMSTSDAQRNQFLSRMQTNNASPRDYPHGVVQALAIMNGPELGQATDTNQTNLLAAIEAPFLSADDQVETLFLATLSRFPSSSESSQFRSLIDAAKDAQQCMLARSDLLWVLLNSAECATCP